MLTTEERKRIVDDAAAHVERAMASARAQHNSHCTARRRHLNRAWALANPPSYDDEDDYIIEFVDERREYGTLWAYNGSVVG